MSLNIFFDLFLWLAVGLLVGGLAFSGFRNYKKTKSKVSLYSGIAWTLLATGLELWSIPLLFTQDDTIITYFIFTGTIFYTLAFLMQNFNMWYILFRNKIPAWLVMLPATVVWVITEYLDTNALLTNEDYVNISDKGIELQQLPPIFSLLTIAFFVTGLYFIRIAHKIDKGYARLRAYLLGFLYVLLAVYQVSAVLTIDVSGSQNTERSIFIVIAIITVSITFALSGYKPKK